MHGCFHTSGSSNNHQIWKVCSGCILKHFYLLNWFRLGMKSNWTLGTMTWTRRELAPGDASVIGELVVVSFPIENLYSEWTFGSSEVKKGVRLEAKAWTSSECPSMCWVLCPGLHVCHLIWALGTPFTEKAALCIQRRACAPLNHLLQVFAQKSPSPRGPTPTVPTPLSCFVFSPGNSSGSTLLYIYFTYLSCLLLVFCTGNKAPRRRDLFLFTTIYSGLKAPPGT